MTKIDRGGKMKPMRGNVTVFDDGSEVQESVCERYCVHTDGGACTGHLTEDGTQLHSRMRRWRRGEWELELNPTRHVLQTHLNGEMVSEFDQVAHQLQYGKLILAIHHQEQHASMVDGSERATALRQWTATTRDRYREAVEIADTKDRSRGSDLDCCLDSLASHLATLPQAYEQSRRILKPKTSPRTKVSEAKTSYPSFPGIEPRPSTPDGLKTQAMDRSTQKKTSYANRLYTKRRTISYQSTAQSEQRARAEIGFLRSQSYHVDKEFEDIIRELAAEAMSNGPRGLVTEDSRRQ